MTHNKLIREIVASNNERIVTRLLRVGTLVLAICVAAFCFIARKIHANAGDTLVQFGRPLMHLTQTRSDENLKLIINGFRFAYSTGLSEKDLSELTAELKKGCAKYPLGVYSKLLENKELQPSIFQKEKNHATIACFAKLRDAKTFSDWVQHIDDFSDSGDLSTFGNMQYAYLEKVGDRTRFVTMSSAGPLNLTAMFPAQGDASGTDITGMPRPPKARRILSTLVGGRNEHITLYESTVSEIEKLIEMYSPILKKNGWQVNVVEHKTCNAKRPCVVSYMVQKGTHVFLMGIGRGENNTSIVSFVNMDANASANATNLALR